MDCLWATAVLCSLVAGHGFGVHLRGNDFANPICIILFLVFGRRGLEGCIDSYINSSVGHHEVLFVSFMATEGTGLQQLGHSIQFQGCVLVHRETAPLFHRDHK